MREPRIIDQAIGRFGLDLSGLVVFTEAATSHFALTPLIALRAGAAHVVALARDSRFGRKEEGQAAARRWVAAAGYEDRLTVVYDHGAIGDADIVTNLGAVRPIGREIVASMKPTAVVPLMYESWEWRPGDLDWGACQERGILVLGTNEHHRALRMFDYVGALAGKLLLETGVEITHCRVLVVGGGAFGEAVVRFLVQNQADAHLVCPAEFVPPAVAAHWAGASLGAAEVRKPLAEADAVVFVEHLREGLLLGPGGELGVDELRATNADLRIAHISGLIDADALARSGFLVVPQPVTRAPRTMSVTTAYLGARPVIDLHAAGLKVGEEMARARLAGRGLSVAKRRALRNALCQDFPCRVGQG